MVRSLGSTELVITGRPKALTLHYILGDPSVRVSPPVDGIIPFPSDPDAGRNRYTGERLPVRRLFGFGGPW